MTYCIYTDTDAAETTPDHVFPLSLGGCDAFCVPCETNFNSLMGDTVDGVLANGPFVMFARRNADARGHSKTDPVPVWKKTTLAGRPVQVAWAKEEVRVWDAKSRTVLSDSDVAGKEMTTKLSLDRFASIRFIARVALGGAYFIYGDSIRSAMDCNELRRLITLDPAAARADPALLNSTASIADRFSGEINTSADLMMYKALCEIHDCSTLIVVPHDDGISFHVSALGMYHGSISLPATTGQLPIDGLYDVGHVVWIDNKRLERASLRDFAGRFYKQMTGENPPPPPTA